jgi:hypothetical protein
MKDFIKRVCLMIAAVVCGTIVLAGPTQAAQSEKLFDVDVKKQKAAWEKDFTQAGEFLSQTKLQNARSQAELLDHKLKQMKAGISKEEAASYQSKIDNITVKIGVKEDSLVKVTMEILNTKGVDQALDYLQNDLRLFGVSEKKTSAAEKTVLDEAPKVQQAIERKAIERTVHALQNKEPLDPDLDPYIVKTAERIIKAHNDSVAAVENAKLRKEAEEKQRQERVLREKEEKEKKIADEKAAKLKQEEDKKRLAEQEAQKKKLEAEEKEKQRLAKIEEDRRKKLSAKEQKAIKDSLFAALKSADQQAKQEKEQQRKLAEQQKEQERAARAGEDKTKQELAQREKARGDSVAAAQQVVAQQEKQRQSAPSAPSALEKEAAGGAEKRSKQEMVLQEKARMDSIAAAQKASEQSAQAEKERQRTVAAQQKEQEKAARLEEERRQQKLALQEKAQRDSMAAAQKRGVAQSQQEKEQQLKLAAQQKEQERLARAEEDRKKKERAMREQFDRDSIESARTQLAISKSAQEYLKGLRDNQKKAQNMVMALYDLVDKKRANEALEKFKQDRGFIAQNVDAQVFNVLEQTIFQSVMLSQSKGVSETSPEKSQAAVPPEQEIIDKINSFMRDNKIEAAYGELKRTEKTLKRYMTGEEFRQLKNMVENAYKIRKQGENQK